MKKLIIITLIIAMVLTGCNTPTDTNDTTKTHTITEYTTEGKETKLIPDETATGELTISNWGYYDPNNAADYHNTAIRMFQELYPNVKVDLQIPEWNSIDFTQYTNQLAAEIMSGNGPDLFWMVGDAQDPYKMMESGALADLTPYIEDDKNFNIDDFNKNVFYEGQLNGKQYVVPLNYMLPLMLTTQDIVDEVGLDLSKCNSYMGCAEEIGKVFNENKLQLPVEDIMNGCDVPYWCPNYMGLNWIDFENDKVDLSNPEIKRMYELIKDNYRNSIRYYNGKKGSLSSNIKSSYFTNKQTVLIDMTPQSFMDLIKATRAIYGVDENPVVFPWRDINGKIEATSYYGLCVTQSSTNKENAYRFIKLLISEEFHEQVQMGDITAYSSIPINNNVVKMFFEKNSSEEIIPDMDTNGIIKLGELPKEFIDDYMGYINDVENVSFNPTAYYLLRDSMRPYLDGKKSYEECIQEAENKLNIHVSE